MRNLSPFSGESVTLQRDNRSVSEVLGYILVFALVLTVIGLVTGIAMPALEDVRGVEQASNAERAFDVVGDNMAAVYERNAPSRATEIDLGTSEIYYGDNVTMNVSVDGELYQTEITPVILRVNDDTSLVYEGGAVFREERDGGVRLRDPPLLVSSDRAHIPVVKTTAPTVEAAGGTTILLRGESASRSVEVSPSDYNGGDIEVNVTSPRYELWERYFLDETTFSEGDCNTGDGWVECSSDDPDQVLVTVQQIEVELIL